MSRYKILSSSGAKLYSADPERADLSGTKKLTQQQLDEACGENVKLNPDDQAMPKIGRPPRRIPFARQPPEP